MRLDYLGNNPRQRFVVYESRWGIWFPSKYECSYCGGRGYVNYERETRNCPASSDPCEFCDEGTIFNPTTRLVRRLTIKRKVAA